MFQQSGEITKSGEAPDIHELHEHQTKTANIDSIIDWLYNLLKQIWSISSLGVLGINDQDVDELPYLSRPPTTEWWWLWVKSFQRFLWSLCGQAVFSVVLLWSERSHLKKHSQNKALGAIMLV